LKELAERKRITAYLIDGVRILKKMVENVKNIGITAGSSTPDYVIDNVIEFLQTEGATVEELETVRKIFISRLI